MWIAKNDSPLISGSSVLDLHRGRPDTMLSLRGQQGTIYLYLIVV